ncbi:hypothetical protein JHS3_27900 [Jeongeupia sp. HS-3]|uniref:ATP-binding response regulator n=1 Tax=Jeongeupia sp. HS-3 TaxID=1009682 RepID=UPI0018A48718|nr:hybrid sensor histidine kinase/response regulator [Jeongeupia sp. HS-3]BCL77054.1 hypothetical protein JHS3_27900 [Jeongeupia sp. HS-3]
MAVLIVDDFETMRKLTATQLHMIGIERVVFAHNGVEALRAIEKQQIDMVLSDWNLPVMTGLELLKQVRASKRFWNMPFIIVTAESERGHVRDAIQSGVSDLLVKPYTPDRLSSSLEKALAWKAHRQTRDTLFPGLTQQNRVEGQADSPLLWPAQAERPGILIVGDTPDKLLSQLLNDDYRVRVTNDGQKALDICHSDNPPDLVLLDAETPGVDGFEVARRMQEHPDSAMIPIIFVSGVDDDDARQKGMTLGAIDYVTKPFSPVRLALQVRNVLRLVELRKQLQADRDLMRKMACVKDDVARATRHDIKGPLSGMISILHGMQKDASLTGRQLTQVKMIEETTMQVVNLVNLSSELCKIETGTFTLKARPIALGKLLRGVADLARVAFGNKGLSIVVDTDLPLDETTSNAHGDERLCYSVFQNLVKNACEAAPEKSRVSIMLKTGDPLEIAIHNHGAIPPEIRDRFFEKFVTCGKQEGTGIGTYSAKLLTEAQHGSIGFSVDDHKNTTTVTVWLPRMPENHNTKVSERLLQP